MHMKCSAGDVNVQQEDWHVLNETDFRDWFFHLLHFAEFLTVFELNAGSGEQQEAETVLNNLRSNLKLEITNRHSGPCATLTSERTKRPLQVGWFSTPSLISCAVHALKKFQVHFV